MAKCATRDVAYQSLPVAEHSPCIVIESVEVFSSCEGGEVRSTQKRRRDCLTSDRAKWFATMLQKSNWSTPQFAPRCERKPMPDFRTPCFVIVVHSGTGRKVTLSVRSS